MIMIAITIAIAIMIIMTLFNEDTYLLSLKNFTKTDIFIYSS